jgi:hypothetical protein
VNGHWLLTGEGPREYDPAPLGDPYLRGACDAMARMRAAMDEVARRFGPAPAPRPGGGVAPHDPAAELETA